MKVLIVYATTDGQTRKIVRYCADWLIDQGHSVELITALDAQGVDLSRFDRVILAASVHMGGYQTDLQNFAQKAAHKLADMPSLFLSVSLCAAGTDPDDWVGLKTLTAEFVQKTGWTPSGTAYVAGAFKFAQYDFFKSWAMRWIASKKDPNVDRHKNTEYTDWDALSRTLADWTAASDVS